MSDKERIAWLEERVNDLRNAVLNLSIALCDAQTKQSITDCGGINIKNMTNHTLDASKFLRR